MEEESLADRLTEEITLLSTKLVTAVSKQLELEEKLFLFHKENYQLKSKVSTLNDANEKYNTVNEKYVQLSKKYTQMEKDKQVLDSENKKLKAEVEDLTASLFDEANKMVSDASRETYNFKVKNKKLYEEIDEKNAIIESLQTELVQLKQIIELEAKAKLKSITEIDTYSLKVVSDIDSNFLNTPIFSPKLKAIRFDLSNFREFKEFAGDLVNPNFQYDLNNLKLNKWFKKIWIEEFESCVVVPQTNFLTRWQKGKAFWNLVVDGKIKIEPIKGINHTITESSNNDRGLSSPCAFCSESRNGSIEHARLHNLKLSNPEASNESINYPLCHYCLVKIRNICDFFAKLRLVNKNFYKIDFSSGQTEYKLMKVYVNLCLIRCKNFWSKIGYWDNVNELDQISIDDITVDDFKLLVNEDNQLVESIEAIKSVSDKEPVKGIEELEMLQAERSLAEVQVPEPETEPEPEPETQDFTEPGLPKPDTQAATEASATETSAAEPTKEDSESDEFVDSKSIVDQHNPDPSASEEATKNFEETQTSAPDSEIKQNSTGKSKKSKKKKKKGKVAGLVSTFDEKEPSEEEFQDSSEPQLTRKNSKSKQFSEKINADLEDTLKMLEEKIEE